MWSIDCFGPGICYSLFYKFSLRRQPGWQLYFHKSERLLYLLVGASGAVYLVYCIPAILLDPEMPFWEIMFIPIR